MDRLRFLTSLPFMPPWPLVTLALFRISVEKNTGGSYVQQRVKRVVIMPCWGVPKSARQCKIWHTHPQKRVGRRVFAVHDYHYLQTFTKSLAETLHMDKSVFLLPNYWSVYILMNMFWEFLSKYNPKYWIWANLPSCWMDWIGFLFKTTKCGQGLIAYMALCLEDW